MAARPDPVISTNMSEKRVIRRSLIPLGIPNNARHYFFFVSRTRLRAALIDDRLVGFKHRLKPDALYFA